jgi:hypothetical protein
VPEHQHGGELCLLPGALIQALHEWFERGREPLLEQGHHIPLGIVPRVPITQEAHTVGAAARTLQYHVRVQVVCMSTTMAVVPMRKVRGPSATCRFELLLPSSAHRADASQFLVPTSHIPYSRSHFHISLSRSCVLVSRSWVAYGPSNTGSQIHISRVTKSFQHEFSLS